MKNKSLIFVSLFLALFVFSALTSAQGLRRGPGKGFGQGSGQRMYDRLELTDQQTGKIEELRIDHQKRMIDLRAELSKARLSLRELRNSGSFSRSEYTDGVSRINDVRAKISAEQADFHMDVYELLTNEQKQKWSDMPGFGLGREGRGLRQGRGLCW